MTTLFASLPLIVPLVWLVVLRRSAVVAGALGYALAVTLALGPTPFRSDGAEVARASFSGVLLTLGVVYTVFGGLLLYQTMRLGGALGRIAQTVALLSPRPGGRVLLLVLGLSPFIESASGFGVSVVVAAPLLMALGFAKRTAALVGLLGLMTVPWGALAIGTTIGAELSGVALADMGAGSAVITAPVLVYGGAVATVLAGGWRALRAEAGLLAVMSTVLASGLWLGSRYASVELAGLIGGAAATLAGVAVLRLTDASGAGEAQEAREPMGQSRLSLGRAFAPYLFLVAALLLTRLVEPIRDVTRAMGLVSVPSMSFSLSLVYNPGFWLVLASLLAAGLTGLSAAEVRAAFALSGRQWLPASLSMVVFVVLAQVMAAAGMTQHLAGAAVGALGGLYVGAIPFIGGLGGFLTGSNTGSNALFIGLQADAARRLGLPLVAAVAAHNAAGSHLTMASPARVIMAAAVTDEVGQEGELLRTMLLITLGSVVLMAGVLVMWVWGVARIG